jgi:hypothetical protein
MAENKTKATDSSVDSYIEAIDDEIRRKDCRALAKLMAKVTKEKPRMWGPSIVGFGSYHYKYDSGRKVTRALSVSPRGRATSLSTSQRTFLDTTNFSPNSVSTSWQRRVCTFVSSTMSTSRSWKNSLSDQSQTGSVDINRDWFTLNSFSAQPQRSWRLSGFLCAENFNRRDRCFYK